MLLNQTDHTLVSGTGVERFISNLNFTLRLPMQSDPQESNTLSATHLSMHTGAMA